MNALMTSPRRCLSADGASLKQKSSTLDRPRSKKAKKSTSSSRRSLSADLTQSESEFSEMDESKPMTPCPPLRE